MANPFHNKSTPAKTPDGLTDSPDAHAGSDQALEPATEGVFSLSLIGVRRTFHENA
jgi:hypothetical protein